LKDKCNILCKTNKNDKDCIKKCAKCGSNYLEEGRKASSKAMMNRKADELTFICANMYTKWYRKTASNKLESCEKDNCNGSQCWGDKVTPFELKEVKKCTDKKLSEIKKKTKRECLVYCEPVLEKKKCMKECDECLTESWNKSVELGLS